MAHATLLSLNSRGPDVKSLHEALRKLGYTIPKHEVDEQLFGVGTQHALLSFQTKRKLRRTGVLDHRTEAALAKEVAGAAGAEYRIEGRIVFEYGLPAGSLRLRLYGGAFAGKPVKRAEGTTDTEGFYVLSYDPRGKAANVEVRAVGSDGKEVSLSAVKFNAERHEVLNLVAPASLRPLAPEYDRLAADLTRYLGSLSKLAKARETSERHDLTVLHQATGWDARLIALATMAVTNSTGTGIRQNVLYALFRAGLPTDPRRLARVSPTAIEKALRKTNQAGIVSLDDKQIEVAKAAFAKFVRKTRQDAKAPGALSTLHELVADCGLTGTEEDTLADLYFTHRGAPGELWKRAREEGISEPKIAKLRVLGKLGYLTFNNAVLAASLTNEIVSSDNLAQLVDMDLHRAETWKGRLRQLAENGDDDLDDLVPPAYGGSTPADRLDAYAADLARKVRVSFPTHVVRRMIETDDLRLGPEHSALKANVSGFLKNASGLGFELGRVPVNAFLKKHRNQLFPNATPEVEATIRGVKTLTRLYQATPTDAALKTVYDLGFTSAREIAAWPYRSFLDRFADRFQTLEEAKLTHRKAQQISAVTYNVVTMAKLMDTAPRVYALVPPPQSPEGARLAEAKANLIRHFPTLESLFGSVDFCECEHCRSVLSPAAYFVDLLRFLDPNDQVWEAKLAAWSEEHGGIPYPFKTAEEVARWEDEHGGQGYDPTDTKPFDVLTERRPDLPHLPLTCENTNAVLPYIDVANEILEFYVAYGFLSQDAVHDTGAATAPELLAEPQYVLPAAYDKLVEARYPLGLPFDLWLETVRRFLDQFGTPLWQVLDAFRPTEALFAGLDVAPYDRAAILAEYLGIAPAEYRILTAPDLSTWYELYGYEDEVHATTNATDGETGFRVDLNSAKTLSRRLGVSYMEVVRIVRTGFVNSGPSPIEFDSPVDDRCDFNETVLQDANGHTVSDLDFLKINLFVRLWKTLGWTIEETDRALQVFLPAGALPLTGENIGSALRTVLVYLAHLRALSKQVRLGANSPLELLGLWSSPPPDGADSRAAALAAALSLAVPEFEALKELSGLDPLMQLVGDPLVTLGDDHPYNHTLRFVEIARTIQGSGFTVEDLDYLLRHRFDPVGKYRSETDVQLALVRTLAAGLGRLQSEHAVPANEAQASALTDDVLQQKLALVLAPEVVATFMGMWTGTLEYAAVQADVPLAEKLDPGAFAGEPLRVTFVPVADDRGVQHLVFRGALTDAKKAQLTDANPSPLLASLLDAVQEQAAAFFEQYLQVHAIDVEGDTRVGFLEAGDFDLLFGTEPADADKRLRLATALLQFLRDTLGRQLIAQTLATSLNADRPLIEALLNNATLLHEPGRPHTPLVKAFAPAGERGVTVTFYASANGSGDPLAPTIVAADVDLEVVDPTTGMRAKPAGTNSARFEGYFEVPATGAYRFFLAFDGDDAAGEFRLAHLPDFVLGSTDEPVEQLAGDLKAGVLYRFTFHARHLGGGNVRLLVQGENLPKHSLACLTLYPDTAIDQARSACALLAKSLGLIQGLGLSEREVRYLLRHGADFGNLDLGSLPTGAEDVSPDEAISLFNQFLRLAEYARLKRTLAARSDDLVGIFEAIPLDVKCQRIAEVTRRPEQTVRATAEQLGLVARELDQEQGLWRLWNALQMVARLGVPVQDIAAVTGIVGGDTPPDRVRKFAIADELKRTIKARFEPAAWQGLAQPVVDALRRRQRDALVAYVLHNHEEGFENANQLFEYFLIDPGMEPVVHTSRLRLAISSVQLFIQRCLLNLEPKVPPSAINSRHWQWMKRYRVWEANRKIFLFPENWLEPEFRDDKTHLFQELEGALLQGDVSTELAENAFFTYLKGLERLARLDIVALYCEKGADSDPASSIFHVIGRTPNLPHKYFYRRYAYRMWTPWEPVTAEIEGDHIVAAVWRQRLHLFWLTFLEKSNQGSTGFDEGDTAGDIANKVSSTTPAKEVKVQLNWSEYFQGQWTTRESSGFDQTIRVPEGGHFDPKMAFVHVSTESDGETEAAVAVYLSGLRGEPSSQKAFHLVSKNYPPRFGDGERHPTQLYLAYPFATQYHGGGALTTFSPEQEVLLEGRDEFRLLFGGGQSDSPPLGRRFFYQDDQHAFFVEPTPAAATLPDFEGLGVPNPRPDPWPDVDDWWTNIPIEQGVQGIEPRLLDGPDDPRWTDPLSNVEMHFAKDWVTDPATVIHFDDGMIGQEGGQEFAIVREGAAADQPDTRVAVNPGSELPAGSVLIAAGGRRSMPALGLNIVGGGGLTSVLMRNVAQRRNVGRFER